MSDARRLAIVEQSGSICESPTVVTEGLAARQRALARRLDDGYERIDQAIASGADVAAWEAFWIDLLREYESVCEELQEAA